MIRETIQFNFDDKAQQQRFHERLESGRDYATSEPMASIYSKQRQRVRELEDCIRAMIETAYAPVDTRRGVVERAQRTLGN